MKMKEENLFVGIIGSVFLLAIFGGNIVLTNEQLENSYVCTSSQELLLQGQLTNSSNVIEYYKDNVTLKSYCFSEWVPLKEYEEEIIEVKSLTCTCRETASCMCCNSSKCVVF